MSTKPTPTKPAKKSTPKASKESSGTTAAPAPTVTGKPKRGAVLTKKTIKEILAFVGGNENTVVEVSRKSLIDARTASTRAAVAKELDGVDDDI